MTTTLIRIDNRFRATALDRREPGLDFLPEGKVIQVSITTHANHGILADSDIALSLEETIELIATLSSALEKATTFTE
jgi:hypothetical protein